MFLIFLFTYPVLDVSAELGELEEMVRTVVNNQHKGPDPK